MERKKTYFYVSAIVLVAIMILTCCMAFYSLTSKANAAVDGDEQIEPYGIMTKINVTIGAEDGSVWAKARNEFTLGVSTIPVIVELFSSLDYQTDIGNMKLESSNSIADLNIYKTLTTSASIGGVERYWRARVRYNLDNKEWKVKETSTHLIDVNGKIK